MQRRAVIRGLLHQCRQIEGSGNVGPAAIVADQQNVLERRQLAENAGHLAPKQGLAGQQHPALADGHARAYRLGTKGGEQRRDHAAVLQCADQRRVQVRHPTCQNEQALALADAESLQHVGKAVALACELLEADVAPYVVSTDEAKRNAPAYRRRQMPIHRQTADIEFTLRSAGEFLAYVRPRETRTLALPIGEMRRHTPFLWRLADEFWVHLGERLRR